MFQRSEKTPLLKKTKRGSLQAGYRLLSHGSVELLVSMESKLASSIYLASKAYESIV